MLVPLKNLVYFSYNVLASSDATNKLSILAARGTIGLYKILFISPFQYTKLPYSSNIIFLPFPLPDLILEVSAS